MPVVPERGVLLHIGLNKTGTTAFQSALRASPSLAENGVLYRGNGSRSASYVRISNRKQRRRLGQEVEAHPGRVLVSHEWLCNAGDAEAAQVVMDVAADRPALVLVAVRSLTDVLPSAWQQLVKRGLGTSYETWVREVTEMNPSHLFWRRYDVPRVVDRWAGIVGRDRVVVVVSDKLQRDRILRVTEQSLGLAEGCLEFPEETRTNASLSFAGAELLRRVNEYSDGRLTDGEYEAMVRNGVRRAVLAATVPGTDQIPVPEWAAGRMSEIGADQAARLSEAGVAIVGDIQELGRVTVKLVPELRMPEVDLAVRAVQATLNGALQLRSTNQADSAKSPSRPGTRAGRLGAAARSLRRRESGAT